MPPLKRLFAVLLATMPSGAGARAADYDCPRATLIVPYPAGGAADVAARLLAQDRRRLGPRHPAPEHQAGLKGFAWDPAASRQTIPASDPCAGQFMPI